ncbi:DNA dC-_dU-editing enzyme APOBEC-3G-like [Polyodon spathula]|uniref:DNA dC->dU-editing enzyme APOBEC-3G-like n=1 Tax=Polyodon spathula TaxID=7913 RepID=UPI001B7E9129|nr:DNA dC->dU-editing enzyme APOBEC-3G-like [Polyodon spathula]
MKKISTCVFTKQFINLPYATGLNRTWLCQIVKERGGAESLKVHRNRKQHAETICLRENEPVVQAEITWYISWSPCYMCAPEIITFIEKNPNVKLNIFASRLYYGNYNIVNKHDEIIQRCREGLGNLERHERIGLKVMTLTDFQHCFDRFVNGSGFRPWRMLEANSKLYADMLKEIIEDERIKKAEKDKLAPAGKEKLRKVPSPSSAC